MAAMVTIVQIKINKSVAISDVFSSMGSSSTR